MEVARFSEMLVHFCKVAWCHNPEYLLIVVFKELFVDFGKILILACAHLQNRILTWGRRAEKLHGWSFSVMYLFITVLGLQNAVILKSG